DARAQLQIDDLSFAVNGQLNVFAEIGKDLFAQTGPGRIPLATQRDNAVAFAQPGLFSGRTWFDVADHDLLRVVNVGLKTDQDRGRRNQQRGGKVKYGAGEGHQETFPLGVREKFIDRAFALPLHQLQIFAAEFDVTAERDPADPVVRVAEFETQQARAEPHRKCFNRDSKQLADDEVTEFVEHYHHA